MKIALLIICLLELNVITLLLRSLYAKSRSRDLWRKRYNRLSDEYFNAMQKNSILKDNLRDFEKNYIKTEEISAYELSVFDFTNNVPLGKFIRIRRDSK